MSDKLKREFEYKFTYLAGDGLRFEPKMVESLLRWIDKNFVEIGEPQKHLGTKSNPEKL